MVRVSSQWLAVCVRCILGAGEEEEGVRVGAGAQSLVLFSPVHLCLSSG